MAINPFQRPVNFDVPTFPASAAKLDVGALSSNLGNLGSAIAQRREEAELAEIMKGATDASGNLDLNKAATAIAISGRDPIKYINALTAQKGAGRAEAAQTSLEAYRERTLAEQIRASREAERLKELEANRPTQQLVPPDSIFGGGGVMSTPRAGGAPTFTPFMPAAPAAPIAPAPAPPAPGGGAALPGGPGLAMGSVPDTDFSAARAVPPPEQLPLPLPEQPYRVAGPPVPPPQPAAAPRPPAPAVAVPPKTPEGTAFNEAYLATLPPAARDIVKGIATYDLDPDKYEAKTREKLLSAARAYRPDYKTSEYEKRKAAPPASEVQARMALGQLYLTRADQIRERIQAGELTDLGSKVQAVVGQGGPGELRRAIDEGADGITRLLTGAGLPNTEAATYARRYQFDIRDTKETALRKANELESVLRYLVTGVGQGRGGQDLVKGFEDQFGKPVKTTPQVKSDAEVNDLVSKANKALGNAPNPEARAKALGRVHDIMRERGVPPQFWPR